MNRKDNPKVPLWKCLLKKILPPRYRTILKRVVFRINYFSIGGVIKMVFRPKTILFYPDTPSYNSAIYRVCCLLGCKIINNPKANFHLAIAWQYGTYKTDNKELLSLVEKFEVVNAKCKDISKKKVGYIFKEVFGYNIMINPFTYKGNCVIKSDLNAKHDGKVIKCPIDKIKKDYVYQKVINNQFNNNFVRDIRVPIFKERIPYVFFRYHHINDRFGKTVKLAPDRTHEVFSKEEIKKIVLFCKKIGLDCGDLDVLRNNNDGKLYIVDANNTPANPPNNILTKEGKIVFKLLAKTFEEVFMSKK